jgi:hypothetical protein
MDASSEIVVSSKKRKFEEFNIFLEKYKNNDKNNEIIKNIMKNIKTEKIGGADEIAFNSILKESNLIIHNNNNNNPDFITGLYMIKNNDEICGIFYLGSEVKDGNFLCPILTYVLPKFRSKGISGKAKFFFIKEIYPSMSKENVYISISDKDFKLTKIEGLVDNILLLSEISFSNLSSLKSLKKFNDENRDKKFLLYDISALKKQVTFSYSNTELKKYSDNIQKEIDGLLNSFFEIDKEKKEQKDLANDFSIIKMKIIEENSKKESEVQVNKDHLEFLLFGGGGVGEDVGDGKYITNNNRRKSKKNNSRRKTRMKSSRKSRRKSKKNNSRRKSRRKSKKNNSRRKSRRKPKKNNS